MASVYSDEYQRVINALKKARKEKGMTQAQLAEALGKPQSFIAKVENGERRLDVVEFVHLAYLVGLDTEKIIRDMVLMKSWKQ
ncbi:helix-turn-helix transcriptional regulator [Enterobacter cloacae]|uniref:helix-turn-helix domain-containing protein n=1 Tax=Enterobacter TaxID=547 RepID=UPI000D1D4EE0|nr:MULTISPECIES: helix-turn-helix transcriptional regulator [Enterobacter]MBJ6387936.1 helix-turn-helix transcriptional regulator [Enterobacter cloacae]MBJ6403775.1 helix-turn-helix transcriptional regulator [Enterobacter cloacae]MBJ6435038.1 helix-turn-helix transcriptional regulator [Enterobacter cloacae]MBJ6458339.1 helix-turn-helix transcriptional regulator [Enterobacter cloacae]MBJ6486466.1 helix-turn-helix transcriptional regulator [Enterobacter cloacae]